MRRDSPRATAGHRRAKADVLGLGTLSLTFGREVPEDARLVRLTILAPRCRGARVEVRLTFSVPAAAPRRDELEIGPRLHAVAAALPGDATPLAAVEAARAAGLAVRGMDLGGANPSCDDAGRTTPPVRTPRVDLRKLRDLHRRISRKAEAAGRTAGATEAIKAPKNAKSDRPGRRARRRPSASERRLRDAAARVARKVADRSRTRAELVATEPPRMVRGLLAKGGPAERRAAGAPTAPRGPWPTPAQGRALRRNLAATRFGLRLERATVLCRRTGAIHAAVAHEGTTATCPNCGAVRRKALSERRHACPCGCDMLRDQAAALVILGRAVLAFREGPDPGGRVAAHREAEAARAAATAARRAAMAAGAERARVARDRGRSRSPGGGDPGPRRGPAQAGPRTGAKRQEDGRGNPRRFKLTHY